MTYFLLGAILGICTGAIIVAFTNKAYDKKYKKGRYGLWLAKDSITKEFVCSECKGLVQLNHYVYKCYYNYCPTCGAKMDGGNELY